VSTKASQNQTLSRRHQLVSLAAAADATDVHPRTVRRWIAAGRLTGYRVGPRLIRVDLAEVDALLHPIPTAAGTAA
jgi:excisionase family DNA binding protein